MPNRRQILAAFPAAAVSVSEAALAAGRTPAVPEVSREFRGVWIATVDNIDWPSKRGLTTEQQKAELLAILDRSAALRLNAVILQVRPACDALYPSSLEPWSEFLSGKMGQPPNAFYDPLEFAVEEAHRRGLELHAWFNPYRAHHPSQKSEICPGHVSRTRPELVRAYGKHLWLDPGDPAVREYSLDVIRDVVRRYDVDGVHLDDYFYPYRERDAAGRMIPFPDDTTYQKYQRGGGKLGRDDWRRDNVDCFVEELYRTVKAEKPQVRVGISPFGIWRPGNPAQIRGFDAFEEIYADSRTWLRSGWVDYFTPQLYWSIQAAAQSYPVLLRWWAEQNTKSRHLWAGNNASRLGGGASAWGVAELVNQVKATREQGGATGNVHFSMKVFMANRDGVNEALERGVYAQPALPPATPWLGGKTPGRPKLTLDRDPSSGEDRISWISTGDEDVWLWVLQFRAGAAWTTEILPADRTSRLAAMLPRGTEAVVVSAVSRLGAQSRPVILTLRG